LQPGVGGQRDPLSHRTFEFSEQHRLDCVYRLPTSVNELATCRQRLGCFSDQFLDPAFRLHSCQ
jgi:hypothetical protein